MFAICLQRSRIVLSLELNLFIYSCCLGTVCTTWKHVMQHGTNYTTQEPNYNGLMLC